MGSTTPSGGFDVAELPEPGSVVFLERDSQALFNALVQLGYKVRLNTRAAAVEVSRIGDLPNWRRLEDEQEAYLRELVAKTFRYSTHRGTSPLRFGRDAWRDAIAAICYLHFVDPFEEWLCERPEWDGIARIDTLLAELFEAADGPLDRWASRFLTLGPVQRTFEPGCRLREFPVLVGPQAIGKSAAPRALFPEEHPEWFGDSLSFNDRAQVRVESLLGRVIVEVSEMAGADTAGLAGIKAFVTRCDDGATRLSYDRRPRTMLRRCVLVGTADRSECLPNDPAGLTRFVAVDCPEGRDVESYLDETRDQLWAEALTRYERGERANLPRELMPAQAARNEDYRATDPLLEDAVAGLSVTLEDRSGLELGEIAKRLRLTRHDQSAASIDPRVVRRLSSALRAHGWRKERMRQGAGKRVVLWVPS